MIKNTTITVLSFVCILLIFLSFAKTYEAENNAEEAMKLAHIAEANATKAYEVQLIAEEKTATLMEKLKACRGY